MATTQELSDREGIRDLLARNTKWLDGHGGDPADLYSPEITVSGPHGEIRGLTDVVARIGPDPDKALLYQHAYTDLSIALGDDEALVSANMVMNGYAGGSRVLERGMRAEYTVSRVGGQWRISGVRAALLWEEDRTA